MTARRCLALVGLLGLSACDGAYGVMTETTLPTTPLPGCVERALAATPGVGRVDHDQRTYRFGETSVVTDRWAYRAVPGLYSYVDLQVSSDGVVMLSNGIGTMNWTQQARQQATYRPIMEALNRNLAERCGIAPAAFRERRGSGEAR